MKKIVIVEDDTKLRKYMEKYLKGYNYEVFVIADFENVEEEVLDINPDLILLDINLPTFDGFYFLKVIRRKRDIPIIIVSARSEEGEQIRGIEMGADDYVTKPFSMGILLAKINAVLRRTTIKSADVIEVCDMMLLCEGMQLKAHNTIIDLSKNEYKLMKMFMNNYTKVVSREKLLEELWEEESFVDDNTLTVNITRLKKKLRDMNLKCEIITKRGIGYVLK
ncbi:response regulator transcription factor [Clostridium uliginosum]|uniref:Stage 0 sporulation protein A homolog n=1 Tax=Clostridium uliginosum TaxID=119641 RepID=A0A1I1S4J4_9CLOT|nr:response regulator transcription factor [Clostridium uliginosum]SFD38713.1 DNA-binding response regulator, OmpR family, contains REC and winged-helix (wHTH) domain [Clostridium uliginosum]